MGRDELPDRRRKSNHAPRAAGANSRSGTVSLFDRHAPCFCTTQTSKSFSRMTARIERLYMSAGRLPLQTLPSMTEFTIPTMISSHEPSPTGWPESSEQSCIAGVQSSTNRGASLPCGFRFSYISLANAILLEPRCFRSTCLPTFK